MTGLRICLDVDASLRVGPVHLGVRRSPVHSAAEATALARQVAARPGFRLVGLMAYEAQIAGVQDAPRGRRLRGLAVRRIQAVSARELTDRRAAVVDAVSAVAPLEFVNGGGTGSVERTSAEAAVTEVAAGSGLYSPALFDGYRAFAARDVRFDGRVFVGVRTTRIYCRPICPARTPKRENVTYYFSAAAGC